MKAKHAYLAIAVLGTMMPLSQFIPFLLVHGLDVSLFFEQLWATPVSRFFGWDVIVSSLALWAFMYHESRRLPLKNLWVYVAAGLLAGVSAGLPLFLFAREISLEKLNRPIPSRVG
jgi:hypothetical protein